jgi:hypothetical protein
MHERSTPNIPKVDAILQAAVTPRPGIVAWQWFGRRNARGGCVYATPV